MRALAPTHTPEPAGYLAPGARVRDRNPGATHPDVVGKLLEVDRLFNLAHVEWPGGQLGFIVATRLEAVPAAKPAPADLFGDAR